MWPAMRRSPAAEHLAAPPLARQQLRTARNALNVCSTVPASDYAGIATIAPPPEPREATCECVETKKRRLNGRTLAEACVRLSSLSHSSVRQSAMRWSKHAMAPRCDATGTRGTGEASRRAAAGSLMRQASAPRLANLDIGLNIGLDTASIESQRSAASSHP